MLGNSSRSEDRGRSAPGLCYLLAQEFRLDKFCVEFTVKYILMRFFFAMVFGHRNDDRPRTRGRSDDVGSLVSLY